MSGPVITKGRASVGIREVFFAIGFKKAEVDPGGSFGADVTGIPDDQHANRNTGMPIGELGSITVDVRVVFQMGFRSDKKFTGFKGVEPKSHGRQQRRAGGEERKVVTDFMHDSFRRD